MTDTYARERNVARKLHYLRTECRLDGKLLRETAQIQSLFETRLALYHFYEYHD